MTQVAVPVAYIDIRFFVHATEDPDKVMKAAKHILPSQYADAIVFSRGNLQGHHGNQIILFETRIKGKEIIKSFIDRLSSNLHQLDKETLLKEINMRVEKGDLYLRLDKQSAFQGEFRFSIADPIHVRIRFRKGKTEDIVQICRNLGLLPNLHACMHAFGKNRWGNIQIHVDISV